MKKILSLILTVVMITSMSVTAFAADSETNTGGNTTINVSGSYVPGEPADMVISVVVAWDAMNFTYTEGKKGEWLPGEHKYAEDAAGSWSSDTATVKVTNHSNTAVKASLSFASSVEGVVGTFDKTSLSLATAEGTEISAAPSASAEFGISGAAITESKTLGTITVSIEEYEIPVTTVSNEDELTNALNDGGLIELANDISLSNSVGAFSDFSLDLGGYSLTSANMSIFVLPGVTARISNGTLNGLVVNNGTLALDSCTVVGEFYSIDNYGTCSVYASALNGLVCCYETGSLTLASDVTLGSSSDSDVMIGLRCCDSASILCWFDPSGNIFEGTVTNNGDGSWTVTAAE